MQITDLVRDSPLRDLGTVLNRCAHVVVPRDEQDSFEYDPKEEVDIEKEKDGGLQPSWEFNYTPGRIIVLPGRGRGASTLIKCSTYSDILKMNVFE